MDEERVWAEEVLEKIKGKMAYVIPRNAEGIPYTTDADGRYDDRSDEKAGTAPGDGLAWWTNGFWGGILWLLYKDTGNEEYAAIARNSEYRMEKTLNDFYGLHHDVGFMFRPTAVTDFRLLGNERSRRTALHAAQLLAGRFNPNGRYIRAWNDIPGKDTRGWAIIDCMFNLSLLYWASEETGDPRFRNIAEAHATTVMQNFIRTDGSVKHIVEFDPETGEYIKSYGGQGYEDGSSWSRGQGWALYGFMISYRHTGRQEYLETARKVARYCIHNIPEDGIVPIDFRQPPEPAWEDSCGAVVIAGGLLELALSTDGEESEVCRAAAVRILKAIAERRADYGHDTDAVVQNCSAAYHDTKHHITMVYADYFFIEALYRLAGSEFRIW